MGKLFRKSHLELLQDIMSVSFMKPEEDTYVGPVQHGENNMGVRGFLGVWAG